MLCRFAHTEEVLRGKFRSARPEQREDFAAFVARLSNYFDKWSELAGAKDFKTLRDLMIRDQIYSSCHKDLVIFLQERKPSSVQEAKTLAERYRVAHPNKPLAKASVAEGSFVAVTDKAAQKTGHLKQFNSSQRGPSNSNASQRNQHGDSGHSTNPKSGVQCFRCGENGHMARGCVNSPFCKKSWDLATSSAEAATARTRGYKNKNSCLRTFEIGDKVLPLLPTNNSKLLLTWRGPFSVTRKISDVD
ncbi:reverse transcriptase [Plakobranchus ocellatus]|uniref:Reverse transcriptase n=1 Tax=Plakobranchus ocellatus TaxID=259542 RepID=A0AAV3YBX9_9GAST|nr:reverse transcriptase [Plakobranchus ocellatus]